MSQREGARVHADAEAQKWAALCQEGSDLAEGLGSSLAALGDAARLRRFLSLPEARCVASERLDLWAQGALSDRRWGVAAAVLETPGRSARVLRLGLACALTLEEDELLDACSQGLLALGEAGLEAGREALAEAVELSRRDLHYDEEENEKVRSRAAKALARFERAFLTAQTPGAQDAARRLSL